MTKRRFLTIYEYGMGGIWRYIWARDQEEIKQRYPLLDIIDERPEWMTPEYSQKITECDIDSPDEFLQHISGKRRGED